MSDQLREVVVTGAAGGMGQALCRLLVGSGYRVTGLGRSAEALQALASELPARQFRTLPADFERAQDWESIASHLAELRVLHGLVNLAGVSVGDDIEHLTDEQWRRSFAVSVDAPMRLSQLCVPELERGRGSIVHVGSPVGLRGARKASYASSKAALLGLTGSMARKLGRSGIRVNLVLPGPTITGKEKPLGRTPAEAQSFVERA